MSVTVDVAVRDPRVRRDLAERGVAIAGPVLDHDACTELRSLFDEEVGAIRPDGRWYTSGMIGESERRSDIFERVGQALRPRLAHVVDADITDIIAGHFHVNPASEVGGLGPHQDVAIVDERQARSVNGWIPLVDSDLSNGTLRVVEGSHRLGNHDRSLAMSWAFDGLHDLFWELATPIEVPAGTLVLFDTAAVHCSAPNLSGRTRVAVNCLMKPTGVPLIHLVSDDDTTEGEVEVYEVSVAHYVSGDLSLRPDPRHHEPVRSRPVTRPTLEPSAIRAICAGSADG